MHKTLLSGTVAVLLSILLAMPAQAQTQTQTPAGASAESPPPTILSLEQQSRQAFAEGDAMRAYEVNMALHERLPYIADYMVNVVRAAALDDRKSECLTPGDFEVEDYCLTPDRKKVIFSSNQEDVDALIGCTGVAGSISIVSSEARSSCPSTMDRARWRP